MRDIDRAAAGRIARAVRERERILFVGDFDADGATSVALGVSLLRDVGGGIGRLCRSESLRVRLRPVPGNRAGGAGGAKPDLMITVDNGVSSVAGVETRQRRRCRCHRYRPSHSGYGAAHRPMPSSTRTFPGCMLCEQGHRRGRRDLLCVEPRAPYSQGERLVFGTAPGRSPYWPIGSTWLRWARSRTLCRSIATIVCWCTRACCACARAAAGPAFRRSRRLPAGTLAVCGRHGPGIRDRSQAERRRTP